MTDILPIILIMFAAICKALNDSISWHYDWFIAKFPKLKSDFWKINVVSKKVKYIAKFPVDAWHISNSFQLLAWLVLPFFYKPFFQWYIDFAIGAFLFVIVFNIFYNKIFR